MGSIHVSPIGSFAPSASDRPQANNTPSGHRGIRVNMQLSNIALKHIRH